MHSTLETKLRFKKNIWHICELLCYMVWSQVYHQKNIPLVLFLDNAIRKWLYYSPAKTCYQEIAHYSPSYKTSSKHLPWRDLSDALTWTEISPQIVKRYLMNLTRWFCSLFCQGYYSILCLFVPVCHGYYIVKQDDFLKGWVIHFTTLYT